MTSGYDLDLQYIVLKLLKETPMHGYLLASKVEEAFGKRPSNGTLNPLFEKLEESGLIESYDTVEHGRYKKIYSLSEKGEKLIEKKTNKLRRFITRGKK